MFPLRSFHLPPCTTRTSSTGDFRAIRARVHDGTVTWQVATVETPRAFTIHDVGAALARVRRDTATTTPRSRHVPARARPGFLVAVADLVDEVVAAGRGRTTADELKRLSVEYVFGQRTYELRVRDVRPDLVHTTLFEADVVGRAAAAIERVPCVSSIVNASYGCDQWAEPGVGKATVQKVRVVDGVTARLVRRFQAVSEYVVPDLVSDVPPTAVTYG